MTMAVHYDPTPAASLSSQTSPDGRFDPADFRLPGTLTVDALRRTGAVPHYFGLGFIQMKFNETLRMHFWHPALSATVGDEELHDHRYDFRSHVLHGQTTHEVYELVDDPDGDHGVFEVSCKPGDAHDPVEKGRGFVRPAGAYMMVKGSVYDFPHAQFHRIVASECITLVERREVVKDLATVIKPVAAGHVCPFSTRIPEDVLWGYIAELVEDRVREPRGGYHLKPIHKGVFGEASKIEEETLEFLDALRQKNDVMALVELSDLLGAMRGWLAKHHPTVTIEHLATMNEATTRSFVNGHRS
jgi:phosphoribosyl-ATP pyrophosphohydrolase